MAFLLLYLFANEASVLYQDLPDTMSSNPDRGLLTLVFVLGVTSAFFIYLYFMGRWQMRQKLREKDKQISDYKSRLFANISHELRTPLTLIKGSISEILLRKTISQEESNSVHRIAQNTDALISLSDRISEIARYERSFYESEKVDINLKAFLTSILSSIQATAIEKSISFQADFQVDQDLNAHLDDKMLKAVIDGLLLNAIRYTSRNGTVYFKVKANGDLLTILIRDTGKGIDKKDLPNIYKDYYRTSNPSERDDSGFGLGLHLIKKLMESVDGTIDIESELGNGTTVEVRIPLEPARQSGVKSMQVLDMEEGLTDPSQPNEILQDRLVMVIEDLPEMRLFLERILKKRYKVVTAEDGMDGIAKLHSLNEEVSLIISDLMMPKMDGFEVLQYVREHDDLKHIPFLILTARNAEEDHLKAFTIGVDDYLTKPFNAEVLLAHCHHLMLNSTRRTADVSEKEDDTLPISPDAGIADRDWLRKVQLIAEDNLENQNFNLFVLSDEMALSERQFRRKMKSLTGLSPVEYVREIKLNHAKRMLETGKYQGIAEVAYKVGFSDPGYFSKMYKKRFGHSPLEEKV